MERITKNELVAKMQKSRVYLLTAKFEENVDWEVWYNRCVDFDERLDETNVCYINKMAFIWKTVEKVGSERIKFNNGNYLYLDKGEFYSILHGDYGIDYLGVRHYGCTMIYAIEEVG